MLGLLAYISVAGAWFWARSLHPAIVTWPTRIATDTQWWRSQTCWRDRIHCEWYRHLLAEKACRQGWGAALPLAGMTGHQRLVRAGATKVPSETLSCSHQRLVPAGTTLAIARQGGLPVSMRGSVFSLRSDVHPTPFRPRAASLSRPPPLGMCIGWGLPVPLRGSEVCARGARYAHAGGGRENMQGVGEEELSAQDCAPGPGPRYSDLCGVKKCQQGGRTTHHLQMTALSCEKLTRADREPRGEHGMPPT